METRAPLIQMDAIHPVFQPVLELKTGHIAGFEALARLKLDGKIVPPAVFLPMLGQDGQIALFQTMLGHGLAFIKTLGARWPRPYIAINVEPSLILVNGFYDIVKSSLEAGGFAGENVVIELLEGDPVVDFKRMNVNLTRIKSLGVTIALDDIGSAYSSLVNIRDLPADIIKLDQSFASGLAERPEDLHFVHSLLSLAAGLGKRLIVEGVETPEILDAVRVLGAEYVQGYAIARPMPAKKVAAWLAAYSPLSAAIEPQTMLGAYAGHLRVMDTCRVLMSQPLQISWKDGSKNPHSCGIGKFFDRHGLHGTPFGLAHQRFHEVMALYDVNKQLWEARATDFRTSLEAALAGRPGHPFSCEPVGATA